MTLTGIGLFHSGLYQSRLFHSGFWGRGGGGLLQSGFWEIKVGMGGGGWLQSGFWVIKGGRGGGGRW